MMLHWGSKKSRGHPPHSSTRLGHPSGIIVYGQLLWYTGLTVVAHVLAEQPGHYYKLLVFYAFRSCSISERTGVDFGDQKFVAISRAVRLRTPSSRAGRRDLGRQSVRLTAWQGRRSN